MKKIILIISASLVLIGGIFLYIKINSHRPKQFSVSFFNIGQGDSSLITFANGQKMLVDCGPDKSVLSKLGGTLSFFDKTIDYLVVTHPDLDHYGGCLDVLKRYEVKEIVTNGSAKKYDPYWRSWDAAVRAEPAAVLVTMASPTVWSLAEDTLQFFSPDPALALNTSSADSNNHSIVFKLTHGTKSFLFTGDMEAPLETALLKKYCGESITSLSFRTPVAGVRNLVRFEQSKLDSSSSAQGGLAQNDNNGCPALRSAVLKVSHHGSDTGSSETFLAAVQPTTAVISVGKNKYGHPSLRTIRHLERTGTKILRTDNEGDILFE